MNKQRSGKFLFLFGLLALLGCGNTGSNGTGSPQPFAAVASGPLTSLGPLGVAGVRLDETGTQVLLNATATRTAGDLRLGMFTDADGLIAPSTSNGIASTAVAQSRFLGPVTSTSPASGSLTVMGLAARTDRNTLLEGIERVDQIAIGDYVEVFGLQLPGNEGTLATRLIVQRAPTDRSVELQGTVTDFSAGAPLIAAGLRVALGSAQVGVATPGGILPPSAGIAALVPGSVVRVRGTYDPVSGSVAATLVTTGFAPARTAGKLTYIEGFVVQRTSTLAIVGDLAVDTTTLGTQATVGTRVRLRGTMQGGTLRVDEVTVVAPEALTEYVIEGPIPSFGSLSDFTLRGERIDASRAVFFDGTSSSLATGRRVRVKGVAGPGKITATEVTILE